MCPSFSLIQKWERFQISQHLNTIDFAITLLKQARSEFVWWNICLIRTIIIWFPRIIKDFSWWNYASGFLMEDLIAVQHAWVLWMKYKLKVINHYESIWLSQSNKIVSGKVKDFSAVKMFFVNLYFNTWDIFHFINNYKTQQFSHKLCAQKLKAKAEEWNDKKVSHVFQNSGNCLGNWMWCKQRWPQSLKITYSLQSCSC